MRSTICVLLTACTLLVPLGLAAAGGDIDWQPLITVAERKRDADGSLLPLQSYDETIRRGMRFLLDDHATWFKGPPESLVDEQCRTQMPWVY